MAGRMSLSLCLLALFAVHVTLQAQSQLDIAGMALGKAGVASSRGTDALTSNPANMFSADTIATLRWNVLSAGALIGSSVFSIHDINYYFGGDGTVDAYGTWNPRTLTPSERDIFAQKVDNGTIVAQVETMPFALIISLPGSGTFGFSIINSMQLQLQFPDKFSRIVSGYAGKERLELAGGYYSSLMMSSYGISFAQNLTIATDRTHLNSLTFGTTLKLVRGSMMHHLDAANSVTLTPYLPETWDSTYNWAVNLRYQAQVAGSAPQDLRIGNFTGFGGQTGGVGMGIDIGCTTNLTPPDSLGREVLLACSLLDIGWITWNPTSKTYTADVRDTIFGITQVTNSQLDSYKGDAVSGSFSSLLPMRLRLGLSVPLSTRLWDMPLTVVGEYTQGFTNTGATTTTPRIGLGLQIGDKGLLGRLGMQAGGMEGASITAGIGSNWEMINFDISIGSVRAALGYASAHLFNYSAGINFRLPVAKFEYFTRIFS